MWNVADVHAKLLTQRRETVKGGSTCAKLRAFIRGMSGVPLQLRAPGQFGCQGLILWIVSPDVVPRRRLARRSRRLLGFRLPSNGFFARMISCRFRPTLVASTSGLPRTSAALAGRDGKLRLDLVIVTQTVHVQYLVGPRIDWVFSPAAALSSMAGLCWLPRQILASKWRPTKCIAIRPSPTEPAQRPATEILGYDDRGPARSPGRRRLGVEFSSCGPELTTALGGRTGRYRTRVVSTAAAQGRG